MTSLLLLLLVMLYAPIVVTGAALAIVIYTVMAVLYVIRKHKEPSA